MMYFERLLHQRNICTRQCACFREIPVSCIMLQESLRQTISWKSNSFELSKFPITYIYLILVTGARNVWLMHADGKRDAYPLQLLCQHRQPET